MSWEPSTTLTPPVRHLRLAAASRFGPRKPTCTGLSRAAGTDPCVVWVWVTVYVCVCVTLGTEEGRIIDRVRGALPEIDCPCLP